jgi:hypothetical protein
MKKTVRTEDFFNETELTIDRIRGKTVLSGKQTDPAAIKAVKMDGGLLGYYPLDETAGTSAFDRSGNNRNGSPVNIVWKSGRGRSAAEFNGKDSYISIPHSPELNVTDAITLEVLVNLSTVKGAQGFISKGRGDWGSGYTFQQVDGKLQLGLNTTVKPGKDRKASGYSLTTKPAITENEWTHIAVTYDSTLEKVRFYKNGELLDEFTASGQITYLPTSDYPYDTVPVTLSGLATFPQLYSQMDGFMREAKIYNRALSLEEIKEEYMRIASIKSIRLKTEKQLYEESLTCRLSISVRDKDTGHNLKARIFIKGKTGRYYLPADRFSYGTEKLGYFYILNETDKIKLPEGEFEITALTGFEHQPARVTVILRGSDEKSVELQLARFLNLPEKKWFAGEHHIQTVGHGRRIYDEILGAANAAKICEAAGLNYAVFMEEVGFSTSSCNHFIAMGGREWTPSLGGHLCLVNIKRQPQAVTDHFSNMQVINDVLSQGGVAVYTHPTSGINFADIGSVVNSREMPVAVALGRMPIWDVSYGGMYSFDNILVSDWYRYLNLGFKLTAGGSTDIYMNNPINQTFPGQYRTYVKIESLQWSEIVDAYKQGRTFITSGPLILFKTAGKEPGDTVYLSGTKQETVDIEVEASFIYGINKVEIIKNCMVAETLVGDNGPVLKGSVKIPVGETGWLAARVYGNMNSFFGTLAHTSPVYVQYGKEKIRVKQEDVDYFIRWLEDYKRFIREFCSYHKLDVSGATDLLKNVDMAINVYRSLLP